MSIQEGHNYKLTNVKGETALDLSGGDNKSIIGYGWHGGDNQKWQLGRQGSSWTFRNVGTGMYLTFEGSPENGTRVIAAQNQSAWDIWPDEQDSSVFRIFVPNANFNIDLSDHGNSTPGTPITLWEKWEGKNQCWRFEEA